MTGAAVSGEWHHVTFSLADQPISAAHKASITNARTKSFFSTFEILDIAQSDPMAAKIMIDAGREDAFSRKTQAASDR